VLSAVDLLARDAAATAWQAWSAHLATMYFWPPVEAKLGQPHRCGSSAAEACVQYEAATTVAPGRPEHRRVDQAMTRRPQVPRRWSLSSRVQLAESECRHVAE
jgi:hypothetical protein